MPDLTTSSCPAWLVTRPLTQLPTYQRMMVRSSSWECRTQKCPVPQKWPCWRLRTNGSTSEKWNRAQPARMGTARTRMILEKNRARNTWTNLAPMGMALKNLPIRTMTTAQKEPPRKVILPNPHREKQLIRFVAILPKRTSGIPKNRLNMETPAQKQNQEQNREHRPGKEQKQELTQNQGMPEQNLLMATGLKLENPALTRTPHQRLEMTTCLMNRARQLTRSRKAAPLSTPVMWPASWNWRNSATRRSTSRKPTTPFGTSCPLTSTRKMSRKH